MLPRLRSIVSAVVLAFTVTCLHAQSRGTVAPLSRAQVNTALARLPLAFEPNQGQVDSVARFVAHGSGYTLLLDGNQARLQFPLESRPAKLVPEVTITFPGASSTPRLDSASPLELRVNYIQGREKSQQHTHISTFGSVKYHDLFKDTDLTFYGNSGELEYDFTLQPQASPRTLKFALDGADSAAIDGNGDLVFTVADKTMRFRKPIAYQAARDGSRTLVSASFRKLAANAGGPAEFGFELGDYDKARTLVVDPTLDFAGQLSSSYGQIEGMATDAAGNIYLAGTSGGFSTTYFVLKLSSAGAALVQTTLSSSNYIAVLAMTASSNGTFYVTGTADPGFVTTASAYQQYSPDFTFTHEPFLSVISPDGSTLEYATYFGGSANCPDINSDYGQHVAVDTQGNAYIAGNVTSGCMPFTTGAYDTTQSTSNTGFVAKFNPSLSGTASLVYSTFLPDVPYLIGLAVNAAGNAYVTGNMVNGYPITNGAFAYTGEHASSGGVYVTELNTTGTGLVYSAYLGPGQGEYIAVDGSGDAYVTGEVYATDFPTTSGAYQTNYPDGFVTELNATGAGLVYSTYLSGPSGAGATQHVYAKSIALAPGCSSNCVAYIGGYVDATDFPAINALQATAGNSGNGSPVVAAIAEGGGSALFSSYIGGSSASFSTQNYSDYGYSAPVTPDVSVDSGGNLYYAADIGGSNAVCATTCNDDTYVAKISAVGLASSVTTLTSTPAPVTIGQTVAVKATVNGSGSTPGGTVTFDYSTLKLATETLSFGSATYSIPTNGLPAGTYPFIATYSGSSSYLASTSSAYNVVLNAAPTATSLVANPPSVTPPVSVTFTATVKRSAAGAAGTPTGTVAFQFNSVTLDTVTLNSSGVATYTVSTKGLPAGSYPITAKYSGDSSDLASTSATSTVVIQ